MTPRPPTGQSDAENAAVAHARKYAGRPVDEQVREAGPSRLHALADGDRDAFIEAMKIIGYIEDADPPTCKRCGGKGYTVERTDGGGATDGEFVYDLPCSCAAAEAEHASWRGNPS